MYGISNSQQQGGGVLNYSTLSGSVEFATATPSAMDAFFVGSDVMTWDVVDGKRVLTSANNLGLVISNEYYSLDVEVNGQPNLLAGKAKNATSEGLPGITKVEFIADVLGFSFVIYDHAEYSSGSLQAGNGAVIMASSTSPLTSATVRTFVGELKIASTATINNPAIKKNSSATMYINTQAYVSGAKSDGKITLYASEDGTATYKMEILDTPIEGLLGIVYAYVPSSGGGGGGGDLDKIYGVDLVGSASPSALTRTDDAVGLNVTVGTSEITSDFDNCYPWSNIEEVTDDFGNVFVKIPKFYSKITANGDGTYKHQLSGTKHEGFDTLFKVGTKEIDYVMVGKYEGSGSSSRVYSKSGQTPLVSITMDNFRNGCKAHGAGYQQYDFLIDLILKELWLVEMATTNCQAKMYGYANNNSSAISTGATDTVATPTGSPISNTDGKHACKYRGIENPWGNIWKWCDGISFSGSSVYVCTEPTAYSAGKTTGLYEYYGTRASSDGFVKTVAPLAEGSLIQYVTAVGADESSYYCDKSWQGGTVLRCGGYWYSGTLAGLWCWSGNYSASYSNYDVGGRLCYKPS